MDQPVTGPTPLTARRVYALAILITIATGLTVAAVEAFVPRLFSAPNEADWVPDRAGGAADPVAPEEIVRLDRSGEHLVRLPRSGSYVVYIEGPSQHPISILLTEATSGRTRQALAVSSRNQPIVNPIDSARPRFTFTIESEGEYKVDIQTQAPDSRSHRIAIVPQAPLTGAGPDVPLLVRVIQAAAIAIAARLIYVLSRRGQPRPSAPLVKEAQGYEAFLAAEYRGLHASPPGTWRRGGQWGWSRRDEPDVYVEANEAVRERRGLRRRIDSALARLDDSLPFPLAFGCAITMLLPCGCAVLTLLFYGS